MARSLNTLEGCFKYSGDLTKVDVGDIEGFVIRFEVTEMAEFGWIVISCGTS